MVVAEVAGLGRASTGPGDLVPSLGQVDAGPAAERVDVDHGEPVAELVEGDLIAGGARQADVRCCAPRKVIGGAVVPRHGQVLGELGEVGHGLPFIVEVIFAALPSG